MRIQNDEEFDVKFAPKDIHGNVTDEYEHGTETFAVKDGDASLVAITSDPLTPLIATVRATGLNGIVQISGSVDGDPGDGREVIEATLVLEIVSSRARSLELQAVGVRKQVPPEVQAGPGDAGNPLATPGPATETANTGGVTSSPEPIKDDGINANKTEEVELKVSEPEKALVVGDEPSRFPLMGGAKISENSAEPEPAPQE